MQAVLLLSLVLVSDSCVPRYSPQPDCLCGVPLDKRRIVGGEDAKPNQFPWQVGIMAGSFVPEYICGGTLISSDTVLTAAHCVVYGPGPTMYVAIPRGETTLENAEKIKVSEVLVHPFFSLKYLAFPVNDFAIIKLSRPVQFDDYIQPICLPNPTESFDDVPGVVSGWGLVDYQNQVLADNLQTLNVTTMTNQQCQEKMNNLIQSSGQNSPDDFITSSMICAADNTSPDKSPCGGDSGGPLLALNKEGSYYSLVGVVSWGDPFCAGQTPGVFGRITDQLYWIMKQVTGETCPPPIIQTFF